MFEHIRRFFARRRRPISIDRLGPNAPRLGIGGELVSLRTETTSRGTLYVCRFTIGAHAIVDLELSAEQVKLLPKVGPLAFYVEPRP
jgi:hypothetical protein